MNDRYVFPALFCYQDDNSDVGVVFPDLPGCVSQGDDRNDALRMAHEALSLHIWGMEDDGDFVPEPSRFVELPQDGAVREVVLIEVSMPEFREEMSAHCAVA